MAAAVHSKLVEFFFYFLFPDHVRFGGGEVQPVVRQARSYISLI
jgi:hypothetical protein